jgi:hypothetical protein
VDGYKDLQADVKKQQVTVTYDPGKTNPDALAKAISEGTEFKASVVKKAAS